MGRSAMWVPCVQGPGGPSGWDTLVVTPLPLLGLDCGWEALAASGHIWTAVWATALTLVAPVRTEREPPGPPDATMPGSPAHTQLGATALQPSALSFQMGPSQRRTPQSAHAKALSARTKNPPVSARQGFGAPRRAPSSAQVAARMEKRLAGVGRRQAGPARRAEIGGFHSPSQKVSSRGRAGPVLLDFPGHHPLLALTSSPQKGGLYRGQGEAKACGHKSSFGDPDGPSGLRYSFSPGFTS